jgi:hypothetical protein
VLPTGPLLSPALLQSISRVAGAFCENVHRNPEDLEDNEDSRPSVLITARDPRSAYTAERLVQRAALEVNLPYSWPPFILELLTQYSPSFLNLGCTSLPPSSHGPHKTSRARSIQKTCPRVRPLPIRHSMFPSPTRQTLEEKSLA